MLHEERDTTATPAPEPDRQRCQLIVDCIGADCPLTQEDDVPSELIDRALTQIASLGVTLDEYTLLEEHPEAFGGIGHVGWHLVIRDVLRRRWFKLTEALVGRVRFDGPRIAIYRGSQQFQMLVSGELAARRSNGSLTVDIDRATMEEALWRWLDTAVDQLIDEGSWYVDAPSSNFAALFDRKLADVRAERRRVAATGEGGHAAV